MIVNTYEHKTLINDSLRQIYLAVKFSRTPINYLKTPLVPNLLSKLIEKCYEHPSPNYLPSEEAEREQLKSELEEKTAIAEKQKQDKSENKNETINETLNESQNATINVNESNNDNTNNSSSNNSSSNNETNENSTQNDNVISNDNDTDIDMTGNNNNDNNNNNNNNPDTMEMELKNDNMDNNNINNNNNTSERGRRNSRKLDESERGPLPNAKRAKTKESPKDWFLPVLPKPTEYGDEVFQSAARLVTQSIHNGAQVGVGRIFHEFGITNTFIKLINEVCLL